MPRPKREQRPGVYHVTTRGVDHCAMFRGAPDRILWVALYAKALARFEWDSLIFCEMTTHLHMLVKTHQANLARGMQWMLGNYAQAFNRRHDRDGHLVRGRYSSTRIESEEHYAAAWAYIAWNPVSAGLCTYPHEWPWSGIAPGRPLPRPDMAWGLTPV